MRYKILSTSAIKDKLRKETDKVLSEQEMPKRLFDEKHPLGAKKRTKVRRKVAVEESLRVWSIRRHTNTILSICGSKRVAEAVEDDYASRHCFEKFY